TPDGVPVVMPVVDFGYNVMAIGRGLRGTEQRGSSAGRARRDVHDSFVCGQAFCKDGAPLLIRKYSARVRHSKDTPEAQVGSEEEGLVFDHGASQVCVKIIKTEWRPGVSGCVLKEVIGVQNLVAENLGRLPVERV